ncbi:O-antigen biosynthesis glycosyltransferase WbnJ [Fusobacterium necrophorum]|nr:glycosyltransferase [Fusobacterium necrophorum]MBR8823446.1 O-antigen biosynthesis glycosyltransferase WbnJ [Fusobacterium necrophorum]
MSRAFPKISIIMPVCKYDEYLEQAINSILAQTFQEFEFLIIANGMLVDSFQKLQSFCQKDSRVRLYQTSIKQLQYNLNYALDLAQAEIIARMDGDDIAFPTRLEKQYFYLLEENIDLLGSNFEYIDEKNLKIDKKNYILLRNAEIRKAMTIFCPFCHPTIMFKKSIVLDAGAYCFGNIAEDWELYLRLRRNAEIKFANYPEVLLQYRQHSKQMSKQSSKMDSIIVSGLYVREFVYTKNIAYLKGALIHFFLATPFRKILKRMEQWRRKKKN